MALGVLPRGVPTEVGAGGVCCNHECIAIPCLQCMQKWVRDKIRHGFESRAAKGWVYRGRCRGCVL